jgi:hypothetical protein
MPGSTLLLGTGAGLLQATPSADGYRISATGLDRQVGLRCPVVVDKDDPSVLYAGTIGSGVWRSEDRGTTWQPSSEGLTAQEVWWLAQHPVSGDLWAGVSPAAMFKSTDRGAHWQACDAIQQLPRRGEWSFPPPPHIPHVKHIDLRSDDPDEVLAAVEEGWLIHSRDGGQTWSNLTNGTEFDSHTAYFMPNDPNVIVSTSGTGVYRSADAGLRFAPAEDGLDRRYMAQLAVHPDRPEVILTAAARCSGTPVSNRCQCWPWSSLR